jgi:phage replication O-like protein O
MANPQKENGFTAIANELIEALIASNLSGQDFKIALLIIRKTYGFNKNEDAVSLSQMELATGMGKIRCSQVVNRLQLMKILTVTENINGIGKKYKFNKDFETWDTVNKNINRLEKTIGTVKKKRNIPLRKTLTTKDTLTKDTLTKDKATIPEWIPKETFLEFIELRKKLKRPLLDKSFPRFFKSLRNLCDKTRASPEAILNQSIINGWQGIYELKTGGDNGRKGISKGGSRIPEYTPECVPDATPEAIKRAKDLVSGFVKHTEIP